MQWCLLTSFCFGFNSQCQATCPHGCCPYPAQALTSSGRLLLPTSGAFPLLLRYWHSMAGCPLYGHLSHPVWALIPHCSLLPYPLVNALLPCSSFDTHARALSQKYDFYAIGIARRLVCLKWNQWGGPKGENQIVYGLQGYFKDFGFCSKWGRESLEVSSDMIWHVLGESIWCCTMTRWKKGHG